MKAAGPGYAGYQGVELKHSWWTAPDCDVPKAVFATANALVGMSKTRRTAYLHFLRL